MDLSQFEATLRRLVGAFLRENAKLNLSAFRTEEACWAGNVLDSLAALDALAGLGAPASGHFVDVGTGGGFPLLPLAVCLPEGAFIGVDATAKKVDAVGRIVESLGLPNVGLARARAEEAGRDPVHRGAYDVVLARALAPLPTLLEYCSPFAKAGGLVLLWKSLHVDEEVRGSASAQEVLKCAFERAHVYDLPGEFGRRQILAFRQTAPPDPRFPRAVGVPKKSPL